jgi:glycosyltransferase involved in cell wall biosynthesis
VPDSPPQTVAILAPDLSTSGGVKTVVRFLVDALEASARYRPELISVALSSTDRASLRLVSPATWGGVDVQEETTDTLTYQHVGARATEIEYQRYQPRPELTELLNQADLVQVVAGTPAWAQLCRDVEVPVALQVATLARVEREAMLAKATGPSGLWRRAMTRLTDRLDRTALDHVDVAFVENAWMESSLMESMGERRVIFAPPGVDISNFHPGPRPSTGDYILSVGRFADARKNASLLFESYAGLVEEWPEAPRLVLAGRTAPPPSAWQRADELGILRRVEMRHNISFDELVYLYRHASLYIVSSDEEGLGLTILEAMACGRPVVSTRCGGPDAVIVDGQTGRLTPTGDAVTLAQASREVLSDPKKANQMGRRGRERVEKHFSLKATGQRFIEAYDKMMETRQ